MFSDDVPVHVIDLGKQEINRWADVIKHEAAVAAGLVDEIRTACKNELAKCPAKLERGSILDWIAPILEENIEFVVGICGELLYGLLRGRYTGEIRAWADAVGVSPGVMTAVNCAYELCHLPLGRFFGCTAGVRWVERLGMVHVRNLDWPLAGIGGATRLYHFRRGAREFLAVGLPGQVGVLSGLLPRAYSVTLNSAPAADLPMAGFGPVFLLRATLEECDSYDAAVAKLSNTTLFAGALFTVCGTEKDQACVIERTPAECEVRPATDSVVVQTNHYVAHRFLEKNKALPGTEVDDDEFCLVGSQRRAEIMERALRGIDASCSLEDVAQVLDLRHVQNEITCQQMAFCPKTSEIRVWRRVKT